LRPSLFTCFCSLLPFDFVPPATFHLPYTFLGFVPLRLHRYVTAILLLPLRVLMRCCSSLCSSVVYRRFPTLLFISLPFTTVPVAILLTTARFLPFTPPFLPTFVFTLPFVRYCVFTSTFLFSTLLLPFVRSVVCLRCSTDYVTFLVRCNWILPVHPLFYTYRFLVLLRTFCSTACSERSSRWCCSILQPHLRTTPTAYLRISAFLPRITGYFYGATFTVLITTAILATPTCSTC